MISLSQISVILASAKISLIFEIACLRSLRSVGIHAASIQYEEQPYDFAILVYRSCRQLLNPFSGLPPWPLQLTLVEKGDKKESRGWIVGHSVESTEFNCRFYSGFYRIVTLF